MQVNKVFCPRCGADGQKLAIGAMLRAELPDGRNVYVVAGKEGETVAGLRKKGVIEPTYELQWLDLRPEERVPDTGVCDACKTEMTKWAEIVKQGGVYFKCRACHKTGVIHAGTEMAVAIRKASEAKPQDPVGIEFHKCDQHTETLGKGGNGNLQD